MSIDVLTAAFKMQFNWNAQDTLPGSEPTKHEQTVVKTLSYAATTSPTTAGGANECIGQVRYISSGGTDTVDLSAALTNVVKDTGVTLVRVKAIVAYLLGTAETIGAAGSEITGNACTGIQIGGASSNPAKLFFGTTASKIDVISEGKGGFAALGCGGNVGVYLSSGMNDQLLVANLDSSNTAAYFLGIVGGAS